MDKIFKFSCEIAHYEKISVSFFSSFLLVSAKYLFFGKARQ